MTDIDANISQENIDDAIEYNRAVLQEQDPTLDISEGGPADSLLVAGQAFVTARNTADVDKAYLFQQMRAIATGTVTIDDETMDELMASWFLTRYEEVDASGATKFIVSRNQVYEFQSGYTIRYNDLAYQLAISVTVYPVGTVGVDFTDPANVLLEQVYDSETGYQYQFSLTVVSQEAVASAIRVSGDRFIPDQSFSALGYIQAVSNFTGGTPRETNAEFATRALLGVVPSTTSGLDSISRLVSETITYAVAAAVGTGNPLLTRDRDNVFNLPTGAKSDIYVKSGAVAQSGFSVEATVTDFTTREITITLTREQSAGVYTQSLAPLNLTTPPVIVSGTLDIVSVANNVWTSPGAFNPVMPAQYDRAFSARQQIVLVATDTRQDGSGYVVPMTVNGQVITDSYVVSTSYQPGVLELDTVLTDPQNRPPGSDVLVKAAVPCTITVGVVAIKPVSYNGETAAVIAAQLSAAINELAIGLGVFDTLLLSGLLRQVDPTLTLRSMSVNGVINGQAGGIIAIAPTNSALVIPTSLSQKVGPDNTYFATNANLVTVSLV